MADANTTRYQFVKPEVGASADTWGAKINTDLDDVDALLGAITTAGSANAYTLTTGLSLAAYVAGQSFDIKASFSNSGAATIDVDAIGAKSITKNGTTALVTGDIVSGNIYRISYDGTQFQLVGTTGTGVYQPLDATVTAFAALSWSSGNPLVQFTAADTVSLTLTPSVTTLTTASTSASTAGVTAKNATDNASVEALRVEGDRATPGSSDLVRIGVYLSDLAGNQGEVGRLAWQLSDGTNGSEDAGLIFYTIAAGTLSARAFLDDTRFRPNTNDGLALGAAAIGFSDAFFATGAVLGFGNGDFTLTHVTGGIEASGTVRGRVPLSSETGTPTSASANKKIALAGGATINTGTADDFYLLDPGTSARTITRGSGMTMYLNGVDSATATLAANQLGSVHYRSASVVVLAGAFS